MKIKLLFSMPFKKLASILNFFVFATILSFQGDVQAQTIDYTMTWNSLNGSYGGTAFTNEKLTIQFLNVNMSDVKFYSTSYYQVLFQNGANVRVTLGNILTNAPLDNLSSNSCALLASGYYMYFGGATPTSFSGVKATMEGFVSHPNTGLAKLTTLWNSTAAAARTNDFDVAPLTISGLVLTFPSFQNTTGSWKSTVPVITKSVASLNAFSSCAGSASAAQSFTLSGIDLNGNVSVTAPTGFEVSLSSGSGFASSVILIPASGILASTTVYTRLAAGATSGAAGNISIVYAGAVTENVAVSGIVNALPVISGSTSVGAGDTVALSATTAPANSSAWVSSNPSVATVSSSGVVSGLTMGTTTITYTNSNGCFTTSGITVSVGTTQAPVLNKPASNSTSTATLGINYTLPETPLSGSVKLTFVPVSGGSPVVWTMSNTPTVDFNYTGTSQPDARFVASGSALPYGTYNVTLSYQDMFANPTASTTNTNITTMLPPPNISLAPTTFNGVVRVPMSPIIIQNIGGAGTFVISPALPRGLTLNSSTGEISGQPTVPLSNTLFTVTASNVAGTSTVTFSLFIDQDTDEDGILDAIDLCPNSIPRVKVDFNGCEIFILTSNNYEVMATATSCVGQKNGAISVSATNTNYNYTATVNGQTSFELNASNSFKNQVQNLAPGNYEVCISIEGKTNYLQCYNLKIAEPTPLSASNKISSNGKQVTYNLSDASNYLVTLNGITQTSTSNEITLNLVSGQNTISIATNLECQGKISETIFVSEKVNLYPNPTHDDAQIYIAGLDNEVTLTVTDLSGQTLENISKLIPEERILELNMSTYSTGFYLVHLKGKTINETIKLIKQ